MRQTLGIWLVWHVAQATLTMSAVGQTTAVSADAEQPNLLQNLLDPSTSNVVIAAHRGGYENDKMDQSPENSLANIATCQRKGYELYETDVQRTKDGHFVIVHDPTIERETSGVGKVEEMTLLELKELQKRYRDGSLSSERVATLGEFLDHGKGRTVFKADLKPGVSQHFSELMKLVNDHDALEGVICRVPYREAGIFEEYLNQGGTIPKHTLMFRVSSRSQIDHIKERFDSSTIEIKVAKTNPAAEKALELIRYATGKGFVVETHAEGNEEDWVKLIEAGVRIFHTNKPSRLKVFLQSLDQ